MFYKNEFDFYKLNKNEYYIRREVSDNFKYEEIYWGEIIDPDGNIRNRLNEREKYIKDLKNELFFVNNLKPGKLMDVGCGLGFFLSGINNVWKKFLLAYILAEFCAFPEHQLLQFLTHV